jgi:hypothetical protein
MRIQLRKQLTRPKPKNDARKKCKIAREKEVNRKTKTVDDEEDGRKKKGLLKTSLHSSVFFYEL